MRPLIWFGIAMLTSGQAVAQSLPPEAVDVRLSNFAYTHSSNDWIASQDWFSPYDWFAKYGNYSPPSPGHLDQPDPWDTPLTTVNRARLSEFIKDCIKTSYTVKALNAGYYISDPREDDTLSLPGVRLRAIVPSELFRDSFIEWDGFEIVVALQVLGAQGAYQEPTGKLWVVTMNYSYRGRGGISLGGPTPSPDWDYSSLADLDSTNGRLRKIQDGIKAQIGFSETWSRFLGPN